MVLLTSGRQRDGGRTGMVSDDRMQDMEARLQAVERRLSRVESGRPWGAPAPAHSASVAPPPREPVASAAPPGPAPALPARLPPLALPSFPSLPSVSVPDLEQLLGGRVLAWLGGAAVFVGLALLLALAIASGWLGELARTVLAGAGSIGLLAVGVALHERRGRTEAARAAAGAGLAGSFLTLTVATRAYDLMPAALALPLALATGAVATALAVRWHARAIAGLGIVGAVLSPALTGADLDGGAAAFLLVAFGCATAVVLWRRWNWLSLAAFAAATPQVVAYLWDATATGTLAVLTLFGALNAVAALGYEVRVPAPRVRRASAFLLVLNAVVLAAAGYVALYEKSGETLGVAWLAGLAVAHAAAAAALAARVPAARDARHLCLVLAVLSADVGIAIAVDGPGRVIAWAAASVGFAVIGRRLRAGAAAEPGRARGLADAGLGGHVGLALVQALAQLHLDELAAPGAGHGAVGALAALAAACLVSGRLAEDGRHDLRVVLDAAGLAAAALLAALTLDGAALAGAWALEAVALAGIGRHRRDPVAGVAALAHLAGAAAWALAACAQPTHLVDGAAALGTAALALGAVAGAALWTAHGEEDQRTRRALRGAAAVTVLYFASLAAVGLGTASDTATTDLWELGARQQGQLQLSTLWALTGVGGLLAGLRRDVRGLRVA